MAARRRDSLFTGFRRALEDDTFLALRVSGLSFGGDGDQRAFRAYVEQQLAPTLSAGEIVIMDNLNSHKVAGVREAIASRGAELVYLPPYSPDLNPIELVFSKFKWLLRSAGQRTVSGLWDLCGRLLDRFPASECANYFRHCGYRYSDP
jgi:transposase